MRKGEGQKYLLSQHKLAGILTIYLTYYLGLRFFKERPIARLSAFFLAISPYHVIFSRASSDGIIDIFWSLLALSFLMRFLELGKIKWLFLTYCFWMLGFFTYPTSRFLTPVLAALLSFSYFINSKLIKARFILVIICLSIFLIFPFVSFLDFLVRLQDCLLRSVCI